MSSWKKVITKLLLLCLITVMSKKMVEAQTRITDIPDGSVITMNGLKFVKIRNDPVKGAQFMALQAAPAMPGSATGKAMQAFTTSDCDKFATPTGTNYILVGTLTDSRDGKAYEVRKFADGKCWMVDNLVFGSNCLKTSFVGSSAPGTGADGGSRQNVQVGYYGDCRYPYTSTATSDATNKYGYLYDWVAAMQAPDAWAGNTSYVQPAYPHQGICPTGWHLPRGGLSADSNSEFVKLSNCANGNCVATGNGIQTGFFQPGGSWKGVYSGVYEDVGILSSQGIYGFLWSSTTDIYTNVFSLYFGDTFVVSNYSGRVEGLPIRCIKDQIVPSGAPNSATGMTMQDFTTTDCNKFATPTGTNYTLVGTLKDARDGKQYEVRKFADGKCWMVDNLAFGSGCLKTTFANSDTTGTGPTGSSRQNVQSGYYGDCRYPYASTATSDSTNKYGYLYDWVATTQNTSAYVGSNFQPPEPTQGICPTGWSLPTGGASGQFQALHAAAGSPTTGFWQPGGNWKGVYSGSCSNGWLGGQGSLAYFWSSTQVEPSGGYGAYDLYFYDNYASAEDYVSLNNREEGFAVRCIKN